MAQSSAAAPVRKKKICAARNCNNYVEEKKLSFFCFPKDPSWYVSLMYQTVYLSKHDIYYFPILSGAELGSTTCAGQILMSRHQTNCTKPIVCAAITLKIHEFLCKVSLTSTLVLSTIPFVSPKIL